jgi:hypothetical protein
MMRIPFSVWAALGALGLVSCDLNGPTYLPGPTTLEVGQMDPMTMMPVGSASSLIAPKYRAPTASEQMQLDMQTAQLGYQAPWLRRSDISIEITYTIHNLDKMPGTATVTVNGANEFTNYDPSLILAAIPPTTNPNDRPVVLPLVQAVPVMLMPGESYEGVIREDDMAEAELDLDAIGRWMAPPAAVLINLSAVNPVGLEMVPKTEIVPAMYNVIVSLAADVHMTCDYVLRIRDSGDHLLGQDGAQFMAMPMNYTIMAIGP